MFVTGYYPEAAIIVRQARELGMKMPILGGDGWVGDALQNGREALNNTYISNHYSGDNPDPIVQNFVKAYRARFNREPDAIAALAYDAVKVLADAMTRGELDRRAEAARRAGHGRRPGRDRPAEDERASGTSTSRRSFRKSPTPTAR